ncbi:hypothetical protein N7492_000302 [Penicillium capsulatum]|uniref:Organic solute transporter Ost-alpha n=1 Tax=Penicillium capsulatum TaxID=69766 RepID=A0A9W9IVN2_9EURO|nr:hypothetical protein N7492_000302 [Penicillium capsulatum]KAJ6130634.1 hypothetical protein N7512_003414 [Penicillium capsulatum]
MSWTVCDSKVEDDKIDEVPLWDGGITFHKLALIVGGICALAACAVSFFLIFGHATHYSRPIEQRHIIRILFMVPIYSLVAWLSIFYYHDAVSLQVLGDCYEAFCISAFFSLMCHYIAPDLHSQKDYFRGIQPKTWLWPLSWFQRWQWCGAHRGVWRNPRSGLTWFNVIWAAVFQYCVMRVVMTIVAVTTQSAGRYCEESLSPAFAHVWVIVIESVSVTIAMYCLIQFYHQISQDIKEHQPFMKILSIKLVIFLSFWQTILISLLVSGGAIKATDKMAMNDLKHGLPEFMINIEMFIFSLVHIWSFSFKPYVISNQATEITDFYGNGKASYEGGYLGLKALIDAMNPLDLFKAIGRGARWLFVGRKNRLQDPSYRPHHESIGMQPSESGIIDHGTAYHGGNATMSGGRTGRYDSAPYEEGEVLLAHPQPNPESAYMGSSPWADEPDEDFHGQPGRFYSQGPSPYESANHPDAAYSSHAAAHQPYPVDGPLREQAPMPMPDPFQPPPPYNEGHQNQHL